jgi:hypothetical protein
MPAAKCCLCQLGSFITEEKGRIPCIANQPRVIMKYLMQTEDQLPDNVRYETAAKRFNEMIVMPMRRANLRQSEAQIPLVTPVEIKIHFTQHVDLSDRCTLSRHKHQLNKLAQHLWDTELITVQEDGNENFDSKNAKLYVDTVKALTDITAKRRQWRIEDIEHCADISLTDESSGVLCKVPQKRKREWNSYV